MDCLRELKAERGARYERKDAAMEGLLYCAEVVKRYKAAQELYDSADDAPAECFEKLEHLCLQAASSFGDAARMDRVGKTKEASHGTDRDRG